MENRTLPKKSFPEGIVAKPETLTAGRYGTHDMVQIWGPEKTFEYSLYVQAQAVKVLSELYPHLVSVAEANEIFEKANLNKVSPTRIRELEEKTGHDVIAINTALEESVSKEAAAHINKGRTSADTTQSAKALQIKQSLLVIADSLENLRDIMIEKSLLWIDVPHMETTHLYDALPSVAGRAFAHYAEMLQSDLKFLKFVHDNCLVGKWGDATGNHHSATTLGIDGMKLQEEYCKKLGVNYMIAAAQVPGLEFEADVFYLLGRIGETLNNIANYIAVGRGDDVNIFVNANPVKKKGSSAMPHKDAKNGNPTTEEQIMSLRNYLTGNVVTALLNCEMPYARNLSASASTRINFEDGFKFLDHGIRQLANLVYWIDLRKDRCLERVNRSYGVVTSPQIMTYLTDKNKIARPMTRNEAHTIVADLAVKAWDTKTSFIDALLTSNEITSRIDEKTLRKISNPEEYLGQSKEIVKSIVFLYYRKKLFEAIVEQKVESPKAEEKINSLTYKSSGVDVELGDDASKVLYNAAKLTWENRKDKLGEVIVPFDDFSGLRMIDISKLPEGTVMCIGFDGIGTKVEIAERVDDHSTVAFDLLAMVCDDAVVRGGEPVLVGSILDVNKLSEGENTHLQKVLQLAKGYIAAAKEANVAIINGELAELGNRVGGYGNFNYNWGSGLVWFARKDRMFTGREIKSGDKVVAFREKGFRSNGLSLARKVFKQAYGVDWHLQEFDGQNLGRLVLQPSKIYCKAVVDMHGGVTGEKKAEIHGVVHVTGGGVPGKLGRVLKPSGLGAELFDLFEPPQVMQHCQSLGNVSDEEAYKSWNMGQGMLVITPDPARVIEIASQHGIEAKIAGEIVQSPGILIKPRTAFALTHSPLIFR
ncbi:MAG: lyase family protein [Nanoarchaeota archaeon]|nr:lyase family protein [Nanoarchaeota archaeon]